MTEKTITTKDLPDIARGILGTIHASYMDEASIIALSGELGSGKTTLTQEIARQFKIKASVISPTFVIMKKYKIADKKFQHLIHIDAYRLDKSSELINLGWEEIVKDKTNLIIIEWPEKVPECIPGNALRIEMAHSASDKRTIKFSA